MSQYDRKGAGMSCGGRNQYGVTASDIKALRESLTVSQRNSSDISHSNSTNGNEQIKDLTALAEKQLLTNEDLNQYFEKYPDAILLTASGPIGLQDLVK